MTLSSQRIVNPVRLGIWSIGAHVERRILPAVRKSPGVDVVAVHTRNVDVLDRVSGALQVTAHASASGLLEDPSVEAVYLASPPGLHEEMAVAVLEAGKHLLCEKPLTSTFSGSEHLVTLAREQGLSLMEAVMFLHHPQFSTLLEMVADERFGKLHSVSASFGFPHLDEAGFRYMNDLGGGALLDAGVYTVAAAVALLGADLNVRGAVLGSSDQFSVDVSGSALVELGGSVGVLNWGFGLRYRNEICLWFEQATVLVDPAFSKPGGTTSIHVRHQSDGDETLIIDAADQFHLMLEAFAQDVRAGATQDEAAVSRARIVEDIRQMAAL